ncbi:MAG: hypothetical protein IT449_00825 [Phycisphaerales bacterium]|nr:hypothetical protein [Phycisphaerales bacterium]
MDASALHLRFLDDGALPGAENMARDEALLTRVGAGQSPPTLRLYQWREPTISLGYFQHFADVARLDPPLRELAVVRRLTGGGAILHDLELTYSLALPLGHALLSAGPNALYARAHDAVIRCFAALDVPAWRGCASDDSGAAKGPFFCFARRHCFDVLVGGDKLAGSAQRRTTRAILQHGSLIVAGRFAQQPAARLPLSSAHAIETLRASFPAHLAATFADSPAATLADSPAAAAPNSPTASLSNIPAAGIRLVIQASAWSNEELSAASDLVPKYAGEAWTRRV